MNDLDAGKKVGLNESLRILKKLTPRRRKFVQLYVENGFNVQKAWLDAGFAKSSVNSSPYQVINLPEVQEYISVVTREIALVNPGKIADSVEVLAFLTDTMRGLGKESVDGVMEPVTTTERLRAAEMLGKHYGVFVEKTQSEVISDIKISIDYGD